MLRKEFLLFYMLAVALPGRSQDNTSIVHTAGSPNARLNSINLADVTWTHGFWHERVRLVREVTIPRLYEVMNDELQGKSVHNLEVAAGIRKGPYRGNNWQDAWVYKWIEMASVSYAATGEQDLLDKIDTLVETIRSAQMDDGYISTNIQVRGAKRFQRPRDHEWYNMGHLLTAAALHHRMTGRTGLLSTGEKVCDLGYDMFKNHNREMAHFPINPSIIMGAVEMYRETGNPEHLELASMVIDTRGRYPGGSDNWQDRIPLRQEKEVMGHAVWYSYLYAGAADVFMETGDSSLLVALNRLWHDLTEHKMYVHGGACAHYRSFGIRRDGQVWKADEVFESAGLPYEQPGAYGYNETCGQIGVFMWNYRMLLATGESRFASIMEKEMYNGFLGSMGLDGQSFYYVNPLRWHGREQILLSNSALQRGIPGSPDIGTCCPTNYARTLAALQGMFYARTRNNFWIHHYGANRYDDGRVVVEQKTSYPWTGKVTINIEKFPTGDTLWLRIPEWADQAGIQLNGSALAGVQAGEYFPVSGWKKGSNVIRMDFPMKARLVAAHPMIEETRGQVAVMRGPVLYALEETDLPAGIEIEEVVIPSDISLEPEYRADLLGGVVVLNGMALHYPQPDWKGQMYRTLEPGTGNPISLSLIPYHTWSNRGIGKMTVWMPLDYRDAAKTAIQ